MSSVHYYHQGNRGLSRVIAEGLGLTGNDAYTTVLLHFGGADASTTITDDNAGGSAHTWTARGNAQLDTADKKFGTASLLLDGTGDYIDTPDSADWTLGAGDWTFDCWFNRNGGYGADRILIGQSTSGFSYPFYLGFDSANKLTIVLNPGGSSRVGATAIAAGGWHHAAVVRTGNVVRLFLDGAQEGADLAYSDTVADSSAKLAVGRLGEADYGYFFGWIDEVRISKGIARWTTTFTPPTGAYGP
jgi:hypothetical protein